MSSMNFTCDVCGREVFSCTFVNGMKFCAKCYQETFGETDKDRKIADLETKLAENEERCKKAYRDGLLQKQFDKDMEIDQLKKQLAEKDKAIENWQTIYESVVQTCHNDKEEIERLNKKLETQENIITNLVEDNRASQEWYRKQLVEKDKEIERLNLEFETQEDWQEKWQKLYDETCNLTQDKISFAVEQLEQLKKLCQEKFNWWENSEWEGDIYDKSDVSNAYFDIEANIDNQIKQLKEGK